LAATNHKDAWARRDVAVAYLKLGSVTLRLGETEVARAYRRKSQDCFERLAAADPENVQAQVDLAAAYGTSGNAEMQARAYAEAAGYFKRGVTLLRQLKAQGKLNDQPVYQNWLRTQQNRLSLCETAERAIDDLDFALGQPAAQAKELLVIRASALAARGRHADAAATAEKLRELAPVDGTTLYNVACCYALCVSGVAPGKAPDKLSADEAAARGRYTTRALVNLTEAVGRGYKDMVQMESDPDLAAIRSEREYQQSVERLRATTRPPRPRP
jgi:tetratricopeptide (TPR) repeat protein